jgi:S1-C subfamily serine protease
MSSPPEDGPRVPSADADDAYRRPQGIEDSFAPREQPPNYTPPPPTAPPEERAAYGRPPGAGAYDPAPGQRLAPRPAERPVVPAVAAQAFGRSPAGSDGFDAAPGTRIAPSAGAPESPWWKKDADRDPWRDPASPFWLGRGAIFTGGRPGQLDPAQDSEPADDTSEPKDEPDEAPKVVGMRRRFGVGAILGAVLIALVAGTLGGGAGYFLADRAQDLLHRSDVHLSQVDSAANRPPGSVADIAKRIGPAVVSIAVTTSSQYAVGSGVVVDGHGYVLTNNHVISGATDGGSIVVTFSNEDSAKAQIVGRDEVSDLAVLKVPDTSLTVAALGNSDKLAVGDPVIAIGSPLGLEGTVTSGIVSALGRAVHVFDDTGNSDAYLDAIQTDAAINPGNSGGALVDAAGAVVGINSAAATNSSQSGQNQLASGIGYAIPINYARDVADQLIKTGKAQHGSLDAQGRTATAGLQEGAYLEQVVPKGAAYQAGLRNGDVIVSADDRVIVSYDQLVVVVQEHKPGDKIAVTYYHGAAKKTATVTLGSA